MIAASHAVMIASSQGQTAQRFYWTVDALGAEGEDEP